VDTAWDLSEQDVLDLPVDELAFRALHYIKATNEWNLYNWLNSFRNRGVRGPALRALSEAGEWLRTHGLVAWNPDQSDAQAIFITRLGERALADGLPTIRAIHRLDIDLLPELQARARPQFLRGDFETASFVAMREVEVQVREQAGLRNSQLGTALMQEAFKPPKNADGTTAGPLYRSDVDGGESVALMDLFKGAVGLFKNPPSHRRVTFDDPTEAAEIVLLADLLLRLLRKIPPATSSTPEGAI